MDTEDRKERELQMLRDVLSKAPSRRELAWLEIQRGVSPEYGAFRYGYSVEQMKQAQAVWLERKEESK